MKQEDLLSNPPTFLKGMSKHKRDLLWLRRGLTIDVSNFHVFHHRHVDGMVVSAKNSGTHWLKFMLSHAIAYDFDVEPPAYSNGPAWDEIIGNPKVPPRHFHLPRLTGTHTLPSRLIKSKWLRKVLPCPPTVVLVRDIRDAMTSNFVKWKDTARYGEASFAEYVRGDIRGRRFVADIWWYAQFMNRWGDIATAFPKETLIVRYEDMVHQPAETLKTATRHFGIDLSDGAVEAGLKISDRDSMRAHLDPNFGEAVVSNDRDREKVRFSDDDMGVLQSVLKRYLRNDFGYRYF